MIERCLDFNDSTGFFVYSLQRQCLSQNCQAGWVGGNKSKERDRKLELVLGSTYQTFECDRINSDRNFDFWETNRIAADRIF